MPTLQADQRKAGLDASLELRRKRASLKEALKYDRISFTEALTQPEAQGMKVVDLLTAVRRIGPVKAGQILNFANIKVGLTVSKMGSKQKARLLEVIW